MPKMDSFIVNVVTTRDVPLRDSVKRETRSNLTNHNQKIIMSPSSLMDQYETKSLAPHHLNGGGCYDEEDFDDDDCSRSVHSMPLLRDDDYFYYHGGRSGSMTSGCCDEKTTSSDEEEDEEGVDHVGALIRPPAVLPNMIPLAKNNKFDSGSRPLRLSLQSSDDASAVTFDDGSLLDGEGRIADHHHHQDMMPIMDHQHHDQPHHNRHHHRHMSADTNVSHDVSIDDFISLKVRVAELESQLQLQRELRRHNQASVDHSSSHINNLSLLKSLQEHKLSLECENIGFKQKLQVTQEDLMNERLEARQVQTCLQNNLSKLHKEVDVLGRNNDKLQEENRRLKMRLQRNNKSSQSNGSCNSNSNESSLKSSIRRRSTTGDLVCPYPEDEADEPLSQQDGIDTSSKSENAANNRKAAETYVPFPKHSRRASTGDPLRRASLLVSSISSSRDRATKRPSLLEVLRCSFKSQGSQGSNFSKRGATLENSDTSRTTGTASMSSKSSTPSYRPVRKEPNQHYQEDHLKPHQRHESWSATDEINAQTELFNRKSMAKIEEQHRRASIDDSFRSSSQLNNDVDESNRSSKEVAEKMSSPRSVSDGDVASGNSNRSEQHVQRGPLRRYHSDRDLITDSKRGDASIKNSNSNSNSRNNGRVRGKPRRKSFTLGESFKSLSMTSLNSICSGATSSEDEFDVNSVLWDSDDDDDEKSKNGMDGSKEENTMATLRSSFAL